MVWLRIPQKSIGLLTPITSVELLCSVVIVTASPAGVSVLGVSVMKVNLTSNRYPTNSGSMALRLTRKQAEADRRIGSSGQPSAEAVWYELMTLALKRSVCAAEVLYYLDHTRMGSVCVFGPPADRKHRTRGGSIS